MASRLSALQGATVGIISNGKKNTIPFFDAFETALKEEHGVAEVVRRTKSNYSAPADPHLVDEAEAKYTKPLLNPRCTHRCSRE